MANANSKQPVPNVAIYDFEGQFEDAVKLAFTVQLQAQGVSAQDAVKLVTPRFEALFESGEQEQRSYIVQGTQDPSNNNQPWAYQNFWSGILRIKTVTNRLKDSTKLPHRICRATIRMLMLNYSNTVNPCLKYLSIVQSLESSTQTGITTENDEDVSAIAFRVRFAIQPSAFPSPS